MRVGLWLEPHLAIILTVYALALARALLKNWFFVLIFPFPATFILKTLSPDNARIFIPLAIVTLGAPLFFFIWPSFLGEVLVRQALERGA